MKTPTAQLVLALALLSSVFFTACQKENPDPLFAEASARKGNGPGAAHGGTATVTWTGTCYPGQGYWLGSGKRTWPDLNGGTVSGTITIAGFHYSQQQAWEIWKADNKGGYKDAKKAFVLLTTIRLAGSNVPTYSTMAADIALVENWLAGLGMLSGSNLSGASMPADVKAAYNRLKNWLDKHACDDDDDEDCATELDYWFGSAAHSWPDVNGTATGNVTIGGFGYTAAEAAVIWTFYNSSSGNDPQKAFLLLATLRLSQSGTTGYSGMSADIATVESWLNSLGKLIATNMPATAMPTNVQEAYNRLKDWLDDQDCEDDD